MKTIPHLHLERHPCFNEGSKHAYGRIHLPVAPHCNIRCNYCNRAYDCANESRPGVTSAVLAPHQALRYLDTIMEKEPRIAVMGIAGPGDPMANREETLETLRLVRAKYPEMLLCLASNGLALPPSLDDLAEVGVSHVTVTVNAVDPEIGANIYAWVRDGKVVYRKRAGAELLLRRQMESIRGLHERGIVVKVNMIVIPGVNDHHVEAVAKTVADQGANLLNLMPIHPTLGTAFEKVPEPDANRLATLRAVAEKYLPQMKHCTRCRADAVGLLGEDRSGDFRMHLEGCSRAPAPVNEARPYVAVATQEGILVNQHLGEAWRFQIWGKDEEAGGYRLVGEREAPEPGGGDARWKSMAAVLRDCRAVLVNALGDRPAEILTSHGIQPVEMTGFIELGLEAVYEGGNPNIFKTRRKGPCGGTGCNSGGGGMGCM